MVASVAAGGASSRWCSRRGSSGSALTRYGASASSRRCSAGKPIWFVHPPLEERLGGDPEVEIGIEHAAERLDRQQRLLQQHELRLDHDVEPARRGEQLHQHAAERDLLQRPVEHRLADDADLALELVDAGVRRHPARLDVRGRHAVVVAAEEGEEVLREVALVALGEHAHDAEVDGDVLAVVRAVDGDEDVARVHVGVEVRVAEHLREEELDAGARELLQVDAGLDQPVHLRDRDAAHPLHHHHLAGAVVPVHLGHLQQRRILEVAAQQRAVGGLAHQVELVA